MSEEKLQPPFVRFETRSVEDRDATIEAGHYVGRDVVFALVTAPGTRDELEKVADEWIANLEEGVKQDRIPQLWVDHFKRALTAYKESREIPLEGTPVVTWPGVTPSQLKLLLDINVVTVEQLADANEETVSRIGMGGRALKQKARDFLDTAQNSGKMVEEMQSLRVENEALKKQAEESANQLKELAAQVKALSAKKENA